MKNIYLLAGPPGSGKSSVARELTQRYGLKEVWSYTERPPRFDRPYLRYARAVRCGWQDVRVYALQRLPLRRTGVCH